HDATQEAMRAKADASRTKTLGELGGEPTRVAQEGEQSRLEETMAPTVAEVPAGFKSVGDQLLGTAGGRIEQHYADSLTNATREARQRMQDLAVVSSTTGSQFGMANRANSLLGQSQDDIKLQNDMRQGDLAVWGVQKAVEPVKYSRGSGAGAFGGIAQGLAGIAGKSLGAAAAGPAPSASF